MRLRPTATACFIHSTYFCDCAKLVFLRYNKGMYGYNGRWTLKWCIVISYVVCVVKMLFNLLFSVRPNCKFASLLGQNVNNWDLFNYSNYVLTQAIRCHLSYLRRWATLSDNKHLTAPHSSLCHFSKPVRNVAPHEKLLNCELSLSCQISVNRTNY